MRKNIILILFNLGLVSINAWAAGPVGNASSRSTVVQAATVSTTGILKTANQKTVAESAGTTFTQWVSPGMTPCSEIPKGPLSDDDLKRLVPDNSVGVVRVKWATESQEETYGFNILRADTADGQYHPVNTAIIPGEGTTDIPHAYCYQDSSVKRGQTYFYEIEEVSNSGLRSVIEGTRGTQVKVKTVSQERDWLRKKSVSSDRS